MAVACPYCQFTMSIRGAKPGRYTPACQGCKRKFLIIVEEGQEIPTVKTFEEGIKEVKRAEAKTGRHAAETAAPSIQHEFAEPAPTTPPEPARPKIQSTEQIPQSLGGYKIEKKLGEGGMGDVYLARQISLDRPVAVKVMNRAWANDADFIARFTREAYAAAQLTHHNVVQIYDIGIDQDVHYFSMEFVPGQTLAECVKEKSRLDPEEAAGYALQAARGLKFAHDHGMIHRDIKPENLLLNEQGIVKVLDLGLVKTPAGKDKALALPTRAASAANNPLAALNTGTTQMNISMGTPAYMSPEQAQDAATVDGRADIYSLGCTLYDFVVGRPPFEGKTIVEVLTKHASEPITPPEVLAKRVPPGLSHIVQKMVAKKKEDRYESMDGVIKELETFLGINSAGPFSPKEEHAALLEKNVEAFNRSPLAGLRRGLLLAGLVGGTLLTIALALFGWLTSAGALAGLLILTVLSYQIVIGITRRTHVFTRVRQLAFGASIVDWLKVTGIGILVILLLWIFGLLWVWIGVAVAAILIALGLALGLDLMIRRQRNPHVMAVEGMLKSMRLKGLEEDSLRQFVCKYSGTTWEEFFESLFGYEAKMQAREAWGRGESGRSRNKFAAWRDGIVAWAEARMKKRQQAREQALLEKLEEKSLRAKGATEGDAKRKAKEQADWIVGQAATARREKQRRSAATAGPAAPIRFDTTPSEADMAAAKRERSRLAAGRSPGLSFAVLALGPHVRLALGIIALAICFLWLQQNHALNAERVKTWITANLNGSAARTADPAPIEKKNPDETLDVSLPKNMQPLTVPFLSSRLSAKQNGQLFNSLSWGIAGVLLTLTSLWRGVKISLLIIPAAVIMIAGETLGIPGLAGWQIAYALGALLAAAAIWRGKEVA